jgi:hypothetical protein
MFEIFPQFGHEHAWIPFSTMLNFEKKPGRAAIAIFFIRFAITMVFGDKRLHPDEYFQGQEMAYQLAY